MPPPSSVRGPGPSLAAGGILLGGPSWRPPSRGLFLFWSRKAARSSRRWLPLLYPAATINKKLGQTSCIHDFPAKLSFLQKTAPFTAHFESNKWLEALRARVEIMQKRMIIRWFTRIALFYYFFSIEKINIGTTNPANIYVIWHAKNVIFPTFSSVFAFWNWSVHQKFLCRSIF